MCNSGPCFPPESQWNNGGKPIAGVLRVALTPLANGKGAPLPSDTTNTYTAFMYPMGGNGNTATPSSFTSSLGTAGGEVVSGNCSTTSTLAGNCNVSIDTSGAQADGGTPAGFLLSMESEYNPSRVTIQAYGSSGNLLEFKNAQAIIDSTGDDQGVLKRIEVRVPTTNMLGAPAFDDTSSGSLCKDISTYPYNHSTNTPGQTSSPCGL